jgi:hypothetical protein
VRSFGRAIPRRAIGPRSGRERRRTMTIASATAIKTSSERRVRTSHWTVSWSRWLLIFRWRAGGSSKM